MSMNVFNAAGTILPRPSTIRFRSDEDAGRATRDICQPGRATGRIGRCLSSRRPGWPDFAAAGAPNTFVGFPGQATNPNYTTYHFHVDFATPANSTFTTFANPPRPVYTAFCPSTPRLCAAKRNHQRKLSRWNRRSPDVPTRLPKFWRSRISRWHLHRKLRRGGWLCAGLSCAM